MSNGCAFYYWKEAICCDVVALKYGSLGVVGLPGSWQSPMGSVYGEIFKMGGRAWWVFLCLKWVVVVSVTSVFGMIVGVVTYFYFFNK